MMFDLRHVLPDGIAWTNDEMYRLVEFDQDAQTFLFCFRNTRNEDSVIAIVLPIFD